MIMRRSRAVLLTVVIVLLHLVILSVIRYDPDSRINQLITSNLTELKKTFLNEHSDKVDFSRFNLKIWEHFHSVYTTPIDQVTDDNVRMQLFTLDLSNDENFNSVLLPPHLGENETPKPEIQHFDPRFTFSLLLGYVSSKMDLRVFQSPEDWVLPYFHWADYVDMSVLDQYYYTPVKRKCHSMFDFASSSPSKNARLELFAPQTFCIDDENVAGEIERLEKLIKEHPQDPELVQYKAQLQKLTGNKFSTGFHIFKNPGRSSKAMREVESKSYLSEFMPPPLSINLLLPENQNIQLHVTQDVELGKKKMIHSRLLNDFVQEYRWENAAELQISTDIHLDVKAQLNELVEKLKKNPDLGIPRANITYERELKPEQFVDKTDEYIKELDAKLASSGSLSVHEQQYLNSLKMSKNTRQPPKYFSEAKIIQRETNSDLGGHYDWRFFSGIINYTDEQPPALYGLLRAWLRFTNANGLATWIAHGSLLSWYWNGMAFPWDNDIDVQMPVDELHKMARLFNQSVIVDFGDNVETGEIRYGRYFLDCGTFISHRTSGNGNNNIDARFVDMDTGFYIDITGLALTPTVSPARYNPLLSKALSREFSIPELQRNQFLEVYNCRNNHFALLSELSPLKLSMVEGELTYVPNNFEQLLVNEYGEQGLSSYSFKGFEYIPTLRQWMKQRELNRFVENHHMRNQVDEMGQIKPVLFSDDDFMKLLFEQDSILFEYLMSTNVTEFHENEIISLIETGNASEFFFSPTGELTFKSLPVRHDLFTYRAFKHRYKFNDRVSQTIADGQRYDADLVKLAEATGTSEQPEPKEEAKPPAPPKVEVQPPTKEVDPSMPKLPKIETKPPTPKLQEKQPGVSIVLRS